MKILLIYETYSGGTLAASQFISNLLLNKGHEVTIKKAKGTHIIEFNDYDFIMLGSPSWLERNEEGQPHENFIKFMSDSQNEIISPKKCAVFGLGDETYAHFARGADIIAKFMESKGCNVVTKPFKLDSYYINQQKHEQQLTEWINTLPLN